MIFKVVIILIISLITLVILLIIIAEVDNIEHTYAYIERERHVLSHIIKV